MWKITKDYSVKSNLDVLEGGREAAYFPKRLVLDHLVLTKVGFCVCVCEGSLVGQDNDIGSAQEKVFLPS